MKLGGHQSWAACVAAILWCALPIAAESQTFTKHNRTFKTGPNPVDIAAADLNGNGILDIVTADVGRMRDPREEAPAHNQLSLLTATEHLRYTAQPQLRTGFAPYRVVAVQMAGQHGPDLVAGSFLAARNNDLTLLRNLGGHLFEPIHFTVPDHEVRYTKMRDGDDNPIFTAPGITSLVVEDFNRDGRRGVVATGWSSDVLIYWPGNRDTHFGEPVIIPAPGGPRDIKAADLDKDGHLDLAVAMYSSNEIALWKGNGDGTFTAAGRFSSRGRLPQKLHLADVNGDGRLDLLVSHRHADDSIVIFYGDGGFAFSVSQEIMLGKERGAIEYEIADIAVADFTGNGRIDIAAACHLAKQVVLLANQSTDNRVPQTFRRESYSYDDGRPKALCPGDFNGNGKLDLAVALWDTDSVALLLAR